MGPLGEIEDQHRRKFRAGDVRWEDYIASRLRGDPPFHEQLLPNQ